MTVERYFVDRDEELRLFRRMVSGYAEPGRILDICAGSGTGKSWLLRQMRVESHARGAPCALVEFAPNWQPDPLKLMRELAERLGDEHFAEFCRLDAILHGQPPFSVQESDAPPPGVSMEGKFAGAHLDRIAGRDIIQTTVEQRRPPTAAEAERIEQQLSATFGHELQALAAKGPAVLLLDGCGRIPSETAGWLERRLLREVRNAPQLWGGLVVVLAGRPTGPRPAFEPWVDWHGVVCALDRLSDLETQHVARYFQAFDIHLERDELAFAHRVGKSRPLTLALMVEELLGGRR